MDFVGWPTVNETNLFVALAISAFIIFPVYGTMCRFIAGLRKPISLDLYPRDLANGIGIVPLLAYVYATMIGQDLSQVFPSVKILIFASILVNIAFILLHPFRQAKVRKTDQLARSNTETDET